jgi:GTP-binding protein EngB required for normal cell division
MDLGMNAWLGERGLSIQIVGNKIDKLSRGERHESLSRVRRIMRREDIIPFSSANGEGKRELWQAIDHQIALLRSRALDARTGGPGK